MFLFKMLFKLFFNSTETSTEEKPTQDIQKPQIAIDDATSVSICPNATFITKSDVSNLEKGRNFLSNYSSEGRPLCILMCWLNAHPKPLKNYLKFYIDNGYDVLALRFTVSELAFPRLLDEIIVNDIIPALLSSTHKTKVIHGFSVAGFAISRLTHYIDAITSSDEEPRKYELINFMSSIKCQVWDSLVTYARAKIGITSTVFPNSPMLQKLCVFLISIQHKLFYETTEKLFLEGDYRAHNIPIKIPALLYYSTADHLSTFEAVDNIRNRWVDNGVNCKAKIWTDSEHVMHMRDHKEEYQAILKEFLDEHTL